MCVMGLSALTTFLLFFDNFQHIAVQFSIIYCKYIVLFATAIYTLYKINSVKDVFMDYITVKGAAEKWQITPRRVQVLCTQGKISGVVRFRVTWAVPKNSVTPKNGRIILILEI